jgi:predicted O-methyltransferase YrrM
MPDPIWTTVDNYINDLFVGSDSALDAALQASDDGGLPSIQVAANQGKMLMILARAQGARRILEIGTLGGYSTIWLARALPPDGRLITLELEQKHATVARSNIARAGLGEKVEVRVGPALESLKKLVAEKAEPFDFVFIDADKTGYPDYLTWSLKLSRRGTMIIADNVVRDGAIADANSDDRSVQAVRRMNEMLAKEKRVSATVLQTVGTKGYDGWAVALVTADSEAR